MLYQVKYFRLSEMACKCGCGRCGVHKYLIILLDLIRRAWGDVVFVTSARRCVEHNRAVGGAENSRHLKGLAVDITIPDAKAHLERFKEFANLVKRMANQPDAEIIINEKKRYIHVGLPRPSAVEEAEGDSYWSAGPIAI